MNFITRFGVCGPGKDWQECCGQQAVEGQQEDEMAG